jgi:hypothetical protein
MQRDVAECEKTNDWKAERRQGDCDSVRKVWLLSLEITNIGLISDGTVLSFRRSGFNVSVLDANRGSDGLDLLWYRMSIYQRPGVIYVKNLKLLQI